LIIVTKVSVAVIMLVLPSSTALNYEPCLLPFDPYHSPTHNVAGSAPVLGRDSISR
jgi:hypothetical protein